MDDVIGLIPAAGRATRLGPLPCSKEILPVGVHTGTRKVRVAISSCLDNMAASNIEQAVVAITANKSDVETYLGDGEGFGLSVSCHVIEPTQSAPETIAAILPFAKESMCALAFPDILFQSPDAYRNMLALMSDTNADVVLGLFPADRPQICDMVAVGRNGALERIDIKPQQTRLTHTWGIAVWRATFSRFMLGFVRRPGDLGREIFVGDVVMAAKRQGLRVVTQVVSAEPFIDVGTPQGLKAAWRLSLT